MLNFDVGLWASIVELPRARVGKVALNVVIGRYSTEGVPQVPLRESSEGDLNSSSGGNTALPFGNPNGGGAKTCSFRHDQLRG
ncbi:unnamed protein product [Prunus armeniaca]